MKLSSTVLLLSISVAASSVVPQINDTGGANNDNVSHMLQSSSDAPVADEFDNEFHNEFVKELAEDDELTDNFGDELGNESKRDDIVETLLDTTNLDDTQHFDDHFLSSNADNANPTSEEGTFLRGARANRYLASCSGNKRVTMYKFCIDGDCDSGAHGEHRLKMDGQWLWNGFRDFREGQCHNIGQYSKTVSAWKSLTVGTEEHDTTSENDSWFGTMPAGQWYSPSCGTYEIIMSKQHKAAKQKSQCISTRWSGSYKGIIEGDISSKSCSTWTQPAESFLWYLKVEPDGPISGWKTFKNNLGQNYCMDLKAANAVNGNRVWLYHCNGTPAQSWYLDSSGRIHSGVNCNKCLEAGRSGTLYTKMFVWDCHNGMHQRWTLQSDGRIRNKAYAKYIGVASGCSGVDSGRSLELHDKFIDGWCARQQKWIF
jgi:hypothetical protein